MAYNRKNLLLKIVEIQETTIQLQKQGVKQKWIYDNVIRDQFKVSIRTFNNYLAMNAKKELKELEQAESESN